MFFNRKPTGGVNWILVGLGNPGKQYESTRHNMGWLALDSLMEQEKFTLPKLRFKAWTGIFEKDGNKILVMKPQTYMNLIIAHLGTDQFPRIKVGVGMPEHPDHEMIDWVIGKPQGEEAKLLRQTLDRAANAALCLMEEGCDKAMNKFNG